MLQQKTSHDSHHRLFLVNYCSAIFSTILIRLSQYQSATDKSIFRTLSNDTQVYKSSIQWSISNLNLIAIFIRELNSFFVKNGPTQASFLFIFGLLKRTIQFFTTNQCEKCPSSIRRRNSNPRPFEHESSPITTIPGLLSNSWYVTYRRFKSAFSLLPSLRHPKGNAFAFSSQLQRMLMDSLVKLTT